jgi:hypothetical protein
MPACAGVFGIDEKQFDPDAGTLDDAFAPVDGARPSSAIGSDAAPRGSGPVIPDAADAASPVATGTGALPPPFAPCDSACRPAHVLTVLCIGSIACTYDVCAPFPGGGSYLDCDGNRANGCEASPGDPATCGSCTNACRGGRSSCVSKNGRFMCKGD